jgi:hypothetical protein
MKQSSSLIYGLLGLAGGYLLAKSMTSVSSTVKGAIGETRWECACADGSTKYCSGGNCACCGSSAGIPIQYKQHTANYLSIPANLRKTVGTL